MARRKLLPLVGSICMIMVLVTVSLMTACGKPAATPAPGAPTVTVTAPAKTTTVTVTAPTAASTPAKPIQLVCQAPHDAFSRIVYAFFTPFLDRIEKASQGRITTKRFVSGQLVPQNQLLDATGKGTIDLCYTTGAKFESVVPEGDWDLMFFNYASQTDGSLFLDLPEVKKIARDAYDKAGVFHLGAYAHNAQVFYGSFPIRTLDDLKGKKMRSGGGTASKCVKALGASDVVILTPELYTALQLGTVDGCTMPEYYLWNAKHYEVAKYCLANPNIPVQVQRFLVNKAKWNELGPELQKIVQDSFDHFAFWYVVESLREDEQVRDLIKSKGVTYTELSSAEYAKMKAVVEPIQVEWSKRTPGTARLYELWKAWEKKPLNKWTLD